MKYLFTLILFICLTGCSSVSPYRPYSAIPIEGKKEKSLKVPATAGWKDTGVTLQNGQQFFIAAKGKWSGGIGWQSGPSGKIGVDGGRIFPENPAVTALIGRVGTGKMFTVGDQYLGKSNSSGNLFLRINDADGFCWDNSGELDVEIYLEKYGHVSHSNNLNQINNETNLNNNQPPLKQPIFSQNWAVIIGISKYQYSGKNGLNNLIFADDDAKAFARSLRNLGWNESHIKLLTNEDATQRSIMIALDSWLTKAGPNDQIILFWAGHGFPDPEDPEKVYFATYDTDINIPATGYRMDRVRDSLEERKSKNVILLADTCHAGKLITRGDGSRDISIVPNVKKQSIPKGWVFMVGADTDRQAIEDSSLSNGAFTHSLVSGLNGAADGFQSAGAKDGVVTMGELKDYMKTSMPNETQRVLGVAKHPVITTSTGDPDIWNMTLQVSQ